MYKLFSDLLTPPAPSFRDSRGGDFSGRIMSLFNIIAFPVSSITRIKKMRESLNFFVAVPSGGWPAFQMAVARGRGLFHILFSINIQLLWSWIGMQQAEPASNQ